MRHGLRGPNLAPACAGSAGAQALCDAFRLVRDGTADIMVAGLQLIAHDKPLCFQDVHATHLLLCSLSLLHGHAVMKASGVLQHLIRS